ncbi:hypothetical protein E2C01_070161 [Portunus trituberculatus]|uniref:Uncharacterized protein n=1 Tax=Portunus trituberculatus TaxID=210409 RepID=A0A5B7I2T0_PORTR|nr:hypothetical protein [Portunus trituberculatus]
MEAACHLIVELRHKTLGGEGVREAPRLNATLLTGVLRTAITTPKWPCCKWLCSRSPPEVDPVHRIPLRPRVT